MILTKRTALQGHIAEWKWLEKHPEANKEDYFRAKHLKQVGCSCYLCEWVRGRGCADGEFCLVDWHKVGFKTCSDRTSPYKKWWKATSHTDRAKYALEIVAMGEEALARLDKEEK